jgi:hypothetical protein
MQVYATHKGCILNREDRKLKIAAADQLQNLTYSESRRCWRVLFLSSGLHFLILLTTKFFTRLTELNQQYCYYKTILVPKKKHNQKMIDQEIIN